MNEFLVQTIIFLQENSFFNIRKGVWIAIIFLLIALYAEEEGYRSVVLFSFIFACLAIILSLMEVS